MKTLFVFTIFIFFQIKAEGQNTVGFKFNIGTSRISSKIYNLPGKQNFPITLSGHFGLFHNWRLSSSTILGYEVLFSQIEGKEKYIFQTTSEKTSRQLTYFAIPFYIGYKFKKFTANLGIQSNYLLIGKYVKTTKGIDSQGKKYYGSEMGSLSNIDFYDFGIKSGLISNRSKNMEWEISYYQGINNIYDSELYSGRWTNFQLTCGLRIFPFSKFR